MSCQDDDDGEDEEEAEHDCALVENAGELMPALVKLTGGPTFVLYFTELLPELLSRLVSDVTVNVTSCTLVPCVGSGAVRITPTPFPDRKL